MKEEKKDPNRAKKKASPGKRRGATKTKNTISPVSLSNFSPL